MARASTRAGSPSARDEDRRESASLPVDPPFARRRCLRGGPTARGLVRRHIRSRRDRLKLPLNRTELNFLSSVWASGRTSVSLDLGSTDPDRPAPHDPLEEVLKKWKASRKGESRGGRLRRTLDTPARHVPVRIEGPPGDSPGGWSIRGRALKDSLVQPAAKSGRRCAAVAAEPVRLESFPTATVKMMKRTPSVVQPGRLAGNEALRRENGGRRAPASFEGCDRIRPWPLIPRADAAGTGEASASSESSCPGTDPWM